MEKLNINWFPGHMNKAITMMKAKLALVDIVIEVRDARAVLASTNPVIQDLFKDKPRIILLNKVDLSDKKISREWERYLNQDILVRAILTNLLQDRSKQKIVSLINELLQEKINRQKQRGVANWQIKVMIIGIPNVGKSKLINNLVQRKVSKVANQPGVTRGLQWVKLANNIQLLDTPGILWPKIADDRVGLHLSLIGAIKEQLLPFNEISYYAFNFLWQHYPLILKEHYQVVVNEGKLPLSTKTMDRYFLAMAQKRAIVGSEQNQIAQMMSIFYFDFKKGNIKDISWEWVPR